MVTKKIMFSPCIVCENDDIYDWMQLNDTLDFVINYLDCGLDSIESSIFHENSWYIPPAFELNMHNFFTTSIFPKLIVLLKKGVEYSLSDLKPFDTYNISNSDFKVTNQQEIELLIRYTLSINHQYVLFLGKTNYNLSSETLELCVAGNKYLIPVVKDPYIEKSQSFNSLIKNNSSDRVFVNSDLCVRLEQEMQKQAKTISGSKGALYKKYGEIIALRNDFFEYHPKNPYNNETKYFIRRDKKYILSIDLLHGHFEVYEGNAEKLWIAKYSFSGKLLSPSEMTNKQLKEFRNNHKVEA